MKLPFKIISRKTYDTLVSNNKIQRKKELLEIKKSTTLIMIKGLCVAWSALMIHLKDHTWDKNLCDKIGTEFKQCTSVDNSENMAWRLGKIALDLRILLNNVDQEKWGRQFYAMMDQIQDLIFLLREGNKQ